MASELGIDPREGHEILVIPFGSGDAADIERLKTAWLSNEGVQEYTTGDRQAMSAYLAGRGWTQRNIGEALGVSQKTISNDLKARPVMSNATHKETEQAKSEGKRQRAPKGSGADAPKAPKKATGADRKWDTPEVLEAARQGLREGTSIVEAARQHDVRKETMGKAFAYVEGQMAPQPQVQAVQEPQAHYHPHACPVCGNWHDDARG